MECLIREVGGHALDRKEKQGKQNNHRIYASSGNIPMTIFSESSRECLIEIIESLSWAWLQHKFYEADMLQYSVLDNLQSQASLDWYMTQFISLVYWTNNLPWYTELQT